MLIQPQIQRQSTLALEPEDWGVLNGAIAALMNPDAPNEDAPDNAYGMLVQIHAATIQEPDGSRHSPHRMHGTAGLVGYRRFLPWHRAYLIVFERELRAIDSEIRGIESDLSIPYWDWNADGGQLEGFPDPADLQLPADAWRRNPGTRQGERQRHGRESWFTREADIQRAIESLDNYDDFTRWLERRPHNYGHRWIGGHMNTMASPRDPAFWFHHAQVDYLWAQWQAEHPGLIADLDGEDAQLDPWEVEFNVESVDDIRDLGDASYEYV